MDRLFGDLASGVRMLFRYPTLSLVAILTLGVGIGLSTTVFCVVNGGMFKGLPFPNADRIVAVFSSNPSQGQPRLPIAVHDLAVYQARQTSFEAIGAYASAPFNLSLEDGPAGALPGRPADPRGLRGARRRSRCSAAASGTGDDQPGAGNVVLLGHDLWRDRYGSAADIVGKTIRANGMQLTVIGVMPPKFAFPIRESLWVPLRVDPLATTRGQGPEYPVVGLLKPGVSVGRGDGAGRRPIAAQLEREFPETNRGIGAGVMPYAETLFGPEIYALLYTMLGAGIGVLLIACVNVSNLLVARASLRRREVAVRMALGAGARPHHPPAPDRGRRAGVGGRRRSAWCSASSACAGSRATLSVNPPPFWITFELDYRVMLFVLGLIVLSSLFAGGLPALHAARVSAGAALKDDSRSSTSGRLGRFSSGLVVAELAVSCGLLIAAGLMIKSVVQLQDGADAVRDRERADRARRSARAPTIPIPPRASASSSSCCRGCGRCRASRRRRSRTVCRRQATAASRCRSKARPTRRTATTRSRARASSRPATSRRSRRRSRADASSRTSDTAAGQPVAIVNESFARAHFPGAGSGRPPDQAASVPATRSPG